MTLFKFIKNRTTILTFILVITIISEFFVLNQNFKLKKKISDYHHLEDLLPQVKERLDYLTYLRNLEGKCLPLLPQQRLSGNITQRVQTNDPRFIVLLFFYMVDCANCLENEIAAWNTVNRLYSQKTCQVIGVTDTVGYRSLKHITTSMHIRFPLLHISELHKHLANYDIKSTPVVVFGDRVSQKVIYAHFPTPTNLSSDGRVG